MKHDILFVKDSKIIKSSFFSDSYDVWKRFFLNYDISQHLLDESFEIQLDYFEDPALLVDYSDRSVTVFPVDDLGTIILDKYIARRYLEFGFKLFIQEGNARYVIFNEFHLFNYLFAPMEQEILKKHLTIFK